MSQILELSDFLRHPGKILDARSPGEFRQGRIPGSYNLPILDDEQRALVGTTYKKQGRHVAIEMGFRLVGPDFADLIIQAKNLLDGAPAKVLCWRGGLRSNIFSWLLDTAGLDVVTLQGGYKTFRRHALQIFEQPRPLHIVGGLTGSGKTLILHALRERGEQVLDLEALANHRGSSYGGLGKGPQPRTEQFENEIAVIWEAFDTTRPVWVESESRTVGACQIPNPIFAQMRAAPLFIIERPQEERLAIIEQEYGNFSVEELIAATERIHKRLGGLRTKQAISLIRQGAFSEWVKIVLGYYDRTYREHIEQRKDEVAMTTIRGCDLSPDEWAQRLRAQV